MKNILIPTDFTEESLQLVCKTAEVFKGEKFNVVLFHAFDLPDSIMDMMFLGREKIHTGLVTDEFRNQCKKLKQLYFDTIHTICIKYMYGNNVRVFKNFLEANSIQLIASAETVKLQLPHRYSISAAALFKKSGIEVVDIGNAHETKPSVALRRKNTYTYTQM